VSIAETEAGEKLQELLENAGAAPEPYYNEPLRFSRLRMMAQSPAHFRGAPNPNGSSLDVGTAAHAMVLGGRPVIFYPGATRRGKAWEEFQVAHDDAIILTAREHAIAKGMAKAVQADPMAMRVLDGEREATYYWEQHGRACRGTPDVRGRDFLTELKTGETADPRRFAWKMLRFCYHGAFAWYQDGAELAGLGRPDAHFIVAVEATPPHVVTVFRVDDRAIEQGRRLVRLWFEQILACEAADFWPGYSQSVVALGLPTDDVEMADAESP
jgi:hypothetical protein